VSVFIGFDGFIDTLITCVDTRTSPSSFRAIATIREFATRVQQASGKSTNIECSVQDQFLGGNAPLLAQTLIHLDIPVSLVGCCGYPSLSKEFSTLKKSDVYSFAQPGETEALEFTDGKLLLGKMGEIGTISLQEAFSRLPRNLIPDLLQQSSVIATVNWTMMPLVGEFWHWMADHTQYLQHKPFIFVDLCDPAKRTKTDLKKDLQALKRLNSIAPVILGLNRSEAEQTARLFRLPTDTSLASLAKRLATTLTLHAVIIHTRQEVAGARWKESKISSESLKVPLCSHPKRATGAGDNFNAGIILGLLEKKPLFEILNLAVATSGIWVRTGNPAERPSLLTFLEKFKLSDDTSL